MKVQVFSGNNNHNNHIAHTHPIVAFTTTTQKVHTNSDMQQLLLLLSFPPYHCFAKNKSTTWSHQRYARTPIAIKVLSIQLDNGLSWFVVFRLFFFPNQPYCCALNVLIWPSLRIQFTTTNDELKAATQHKQQQRSISNRFYCNGTSVVGSVLFWRWMQLIQIVRIVSYDIFPRCFDLLF